MTRTDQIPAQTDIDDGFPRTLSGKLVQVGSVVRENRQGSAEETVLGIAGNVLFTDRGDALHVKKAVLVR